VYALIGCFLGVISGLIPGIHVNLIVALPILIPGSATFLFCMGLVHTFVDFIPSTFLGVPEESTSLSVLPAHKLLMKGRGYEAVWLATLGGFLTSLCAVVLLPLILLISGLYIFIDYIIPALLFLVLLFMLYTERKTTYGALIIFLSGMLGHIGEVV
jgi:putative membrane protein